MDVLKGFLQLLLAQFAGELLHRMLHLPLPGPVLGMALLAATLLLKGGEASPGLTDTSEGLLRWLGLLFVPAGVGVFSSVGLLLASWKPVLAALLLSTLLTFAVTAWTMQIFSRCRVQEEL